MSTDSFAILEQARSGQYVDAWPPMLAVIWRFLDSIIAGPTLLLVLILSLYLGGSAVIMAACAPHRPTIATFGFLAFIAWPPLFGIIGTIWSDVLMTALFLASVALAMVSWNRRGKIPILILSTVLLFLGISMRHNAAAAAGPIAILIVLSALDRTRVQFKTLVLTGVGGFALTIALFVASSATSSMMVTTKSYFWTVLAEYDLAGIAVNTKGRTFDPPIFTPQTYDDISTLYTSRSVVPLRVGQQVHELEYGRPAKTARPFSMLFTDVGADDERRKLLAVWKSKIWQEPTAYLKHRMDVFANVIGYPPHTDLWGPVYTRIDANDFGVQPRPDLVNFPYFASIYESAKTPIFSPFTHLKVLVPVFLLAIVLLCLSRNWLYTVPTLLSLSGLLHMAGLFFVAVSSDFRYSYWMLTATVLSTILCVLIPLGGNGGIKPEGKHRRTE